MNETRISGDNIATGGGEAPREDVAADAAADTPAKLGRGHAPGSKNKPKAQPEEPIPSTVLPSNGGTFEPGHQLGVHPLCDMFPPMGDTELEELADDLTAHGQREPIVIYKDQILDGRNRNTALGKRDLPINYTIFSGSDLDAAAFVVSMNVHRRHLDESQRAVIAAKIANLGEGRPNETASKEAVSQSDAAALVNVSRSAVQWAATVLREGAPEVVEAVQRGEMSVAAAAVIVKQPAEEQKCALELPKLSRQAAVRKMRAASAKPAQDTPRRFHVPTTPASARAGAAEKELARMPSAVADPRTPCDQPTGPAAEPSQATRTAALSQEDDITPNAVPFSVSFGPPSAIAKRLFQKLPLDAFREVVSAMCELLQSNGDSNRAAAAEHPMSGVGVEHR
jgi:ParB-like chromosome segregation protein Spo0J